MAKRIEGVTERLQSCAMEEFLQKGYSGASLRTIAENAGTTPRSIYTRYGDKEGLFSALVDSSASDLKVMIESFMSQYQMRPTAEQKQLFHDKYFDEEYRGYIDTIFDCIYSRWNEYKLLVCHSEGTKYSCFVDEIVELEEKYTIRYINNTGNDVISSGRAKPELIHLLSSSFMHGFFEIVRHDMSREDASIYFSQLQSFFACGWDQLLNP